MRRRTDAAAELYTYPKVLLTVDEAARALSLGRTLVYELVMKREIESIKVGRMRRIPVTALQDYVRRQLAGLARGA
jgi:excisionase family DNA binding protein